MASAGTPAAGALAPPEEEAEEDCAGSSSTAAKGRAAWALPRATTRHHPVSRKKGDRFDHRAGAPAPACQSTFGALARYGSKRSPATRCILWDESRVISYRHSATR
jgi:hypothetical protein